MALEDFDERSDDDEEGVDFVAEVSAHEMTEIQELADGEVGHFSFDADDASTDSFDAEDGMGGGAAGDGGGAGAGGGGGAGAGGGGASGGGGAGGGRNGSDARRGDQDRSSQSLLVPAPLDVSPDRDMSFSNMSAESVSHTYDTDFRTHGMGLG